MSALREVVAFAVRTFIEARAAELGKAPSAIGPSTDLFGTGVLDSVALAGLIAAVEDATAQDIDFLDVEPAALGTLDGIVDELVRALASRP